MDNQDTHRLLKITRQQEYDCQTCIAILNRDIWINTGCVPWILDITETSEARYKVVIEGSGNFFLDINTPKYIHATQEEIVILENLSLIGEADERIQSLSRRVDQLEERCVDWEPVDRIYLGVYKYKQDEARFDLPEDLPEASEILVQVNWNTGKEGPSRFVDTRIWTENSNNGKQYAIYTSGYRYPQSALSYDTQCFWFPLKDCLRSIFVSSTDREKRSHGLRIHLLGYRH
eukprot:TRINITY_DN2260_c0_g1_i1.p2 TRINITY_DN2260_c0_g1~~TRINITY_DN2260_c0_g1_i1.p2  ORF type:complete len:232 (-),score=30.84 TRINITY_DN2260_c0_g1_i1:811-1506(-)